MMTVPTELSMCISRRIDPWTTEEEREKISAVMNYEKLTLEACTHAAQNEHLPLPTIVQVLFFEQIQLWQAIAETLLASHPRCILDYNNIDWLSTINLDFWQAINLYNSGKQ